MSFTEINIEAEYRSLTNNIVREFYIPVLSHSVLYQRAVGFFSSSSLAEVSQGVTGLIKNNGSIQLVASPYLSEEDINAIQAGYKMRDTVVEQILIKSLTYPKNLFEEERLNLLASLIAENRLDIKIAFTESNQNMGMYHEKMGLLYDKRGNCIAFAGSMNETGTALKLNYETIDVFCSWKDEQSRVIAKKNAFASIWSDCEPNIRIIKFPNLKREIIERYKKKDPNYDIDELEFGGSSYVLDKIKRSYTIGPTIPQDVKLYDYQIEAINEWENHSYRGIFDMATGTGKTFTSLGAIARISEKLNNKLAVFIVCPYQHLVEQWVEDIIRFNINPIIGYSASKQKEWRRLLDDAIRDQKLKVKNKDFFCFISTNATFSSDFVQGQINKIKENALLVVDEAHNFGSNYLSSLLCEKFNYRLALSATLERHNDEEGTEKLLSYFGKKCIQYPLERAIEEKKLTRYKYYPIIVILKDNELKRYLDLTNEIGKCLIKSKNGKLKISEKGKKLALARARLIAGAEDKLCKLEKNIIPYIDDKHILVYCGAAKLLNENQDFSSVDDEDIRQIDAVTNLLGNKLNMNISQFTSKEDVNERAVLKREFAQGDSLQALIAIKCLDEGVNIPKIKVVFILASTTNPKEYIQRRGRVLRLAEGKEYAEIYDFITLPRALNEVSSLTIDQMKKEVSLVKKEICRAKEFARIAMNMFEAESVIDDIKAAYCIKDNMIVFEEDFDYGY